MSVHQIISNRDLSMVIGHAIYPVTEELLHRLFDPYGVEQIVAYPPIVAEDGDPCVAADVRFSSERGAAQAYAIWDGRCIYYRCCRLQMWLALAEGLPAQSSAPASPATVAVLHEGDGNLAASTNSVTLDHSMKSTSIQNEVFDSMDTTGCVTGPVTAISDHIEFVLESAGLAEPPALTAITDESLMVAPAVPISTSTVVPAPCVTALLASSDTAEAVLASAGLAESPAPATTIAKSLGSASVVPIDTCMEVPAPCSTDCAAQATSAINDFLSTDNTAPVTASSDTQLVTASSGLAEPTAPVPEIEEAPEASSSPAMPTTNHAVSTELDNDDGEYGASGDNSSVNAVPFSVTPTIRLTAGAQGDSPSTKLVVPALTVPEIIGNISVINDSSTKDAPRAMEEGHMNCPTSWPPPYLDSSWCDSRIPRPIPWPSFAILPGGEHLSEPVPPLQGTSGKFPVDVAVMHYFLGSQSWVSSLHICLHYEPDREEDFTSLQHSDRDDQFSSLSVRLNVLEKYLKKPCTEPKEATVSGLISKGDASVFKLWHIPWFSFLFLELISQEPYCVVPFLPVDNNLEPELSDEAMAISATSVIVLLPTTCSTNCTGSVFASLSRPVEAVAAMLSLACIVQAQMSESTLPANLLQGVDLDSDGINTMGAFLDREDRYPNVRALPKASTFWMLKLFKVVPIVTAVAPWPLPGITRAGTSLMHGQDSFYNAQQKRGREFLGALEMESHLIPPRQDVKYNQGKLSANGRKVREDRYQCHHNLQANSHYPELMYWSFSQSLMHPEFWFYTTEYILFCWCAFVQWEAPWMNILVSLRSRSQYYRASWEKFQGTIAWVLSYLLSLSVLWLFSGPLLVKLVELKNVAFCNVRVNLTIRQATIILQSYTLTSQHNQYGPELMHLLVIWFYPWLESGFQFFSAGKASRYVYGAAQCQWEIAWTTLAYSIMYTRDPYITLECSCVSCYLESEIKCSGTQLKPALSLLFTTRSSLVTFVVSTHSTDTSWGLFSGIVAVVRCLLGDLHMLTSSGFILKGIYSRITQYIEFHILDAKFTRLRTWTVLHTGNLYWLLGLYSSCDQFITEGATNFESQYFEWQIPWVSIIHDYCITNEVLDQWGVYNADQDVQVAFPLSAQSPYKAVQLPWDPGGVAVHRLEGKPILKKWGMSRTYMFWAVGRCQGKFWAGQFTGRGYIKPTQDNGGGIEKITANDWLSSHLSLFLIPSPVLLILIP